MRWSIGSSRLNIEKTATMNMVAEIQVQLFAQNGRSVVVRPMLFEFMFYWTFPRNYRCRSRGRMPSRYEGWLIREVVVSR